MIYLSCSYSHPDPAVREHRFREACRATAALIRAGHVVFCPIVQFHPLVEYGVPTEWDAWERIDGALLRLCDEVIVMMLDGWQNSVGVQAEVRLAEGFSIPLSFVAQAEILKCRQ